MHDAARNYTKDRIERQGECVSYYIDVSNYEAADSWLSKLEEWQHEGATVYFSKHTSWEEMYMALERFKRTSPLLTGSFYTEQAIRPRVELLQRNILEAVYAITPWYTRV